ncbi:hypothetical protein WR25_18038 [Diploscapter pachys]|uniref:Small ribosomal subunit protein bS6m n=1 Tax=Diploscapter pachys TaxID=2018661 RepID=A0A2A2JDZ6_9BILA|nr:hypothetical protein WR25_18038 [Diploscapter pachys]
MPLFEFTVITKSLSKADLIKTLTRAGNVLLEKGAVIEKVESLGHRDLPYKKIAKQTGDSVYASNYFLFHAHMSSPARLEAKTILRNDLDTVHVEAVLTPTEKPEFECNLEEILKPPAERESVQKLREKQRLCHFTRQLIYKKTEKEWKAIPKSYPIAPPRD